MCLCDQKRGANHLLLHQGLDAAENPPVGRRKRKTSKPPKTVASSAISAEEARIIRGVLDMTHKTVQVLVALVVVD